jgi:hypothetical protein
MTLRITRRLDWAELERAKAAQAFMERAAERAADLRERRLQRLQRRRQALRKARFALQELSQAGEDPPEIRLRRGFIRRAEPRQRNEDPDRLPQRATQHPGKLADAVQADLRSRPPMTRLVSRSRWAMPLCLTAIFEAHCALAADHKLDHRERYLAAGPSGAWTDPWSTLLGDPDRTQRNRRVRVARALTELDRHSLVLLGKPRTMNRFEQFKLLSEVGDGRAYEIPGETSTALAVPPQFYLSGWHLVLEPREIAVWLMLRDLEWRHGARGVGATDQTRWGYYGVTGEVYTAHYELAEFGLVELLDLIPNRRRGRVTSKQQHPHVQGGQASQANAEDRPRLPVYRFITHPEAFDRDAFEVVSRALSASPPPRFST